MAWQPWEEAWQHGREASKVWQPWEEALQAWQPWEEALRAWQLWEEVLPAWRACSAWACLACLAVEEHLYASCRTKT